MGFVDSLWHALASGSVLSLSASTLSALLLIALFAPLASCVVAGACGAYKKISLIGWWCSACIGISLLASIVLFLCALHGGSASATLWEWMASGSFSVVFGFQVDMINAVMLLAISVVSFIVHLYSIGYMAEDIGFNRYFSFLSGFVFSMMFLVLSDNFLGLFVGWEGVGLCSYLLIGFWHERTSANFAAMEAFLSNRIADLGMLIGIFLIFWTFGSVNFSYIFHAITNGAPLSSFILSSIGVLLFIGAMGKSAQFPLHTWLANAMEGPTPVSALIHAATMVTAGVYLVIRAHPLYIHIPHIGEAIAYLGAFVAIFAASMALVNRDLKRIIAYSTLSQLGYMFVAAGLGAYWVALFHLFTHAFFKSLLFLSAGNIMHAMHDGLDIMRMGRLAKPLKYSMLFMFIGNLALCGIPPFAGYFSKDLIIEFSFHEGYYMICAALVCGAFFTAFYSFRLFMLVFISPPSSHAYAISHPHEASPFMLCVLLPLVALSMIAGVFYDTFFASLQGILAFSLPHGDNALAIIVLICSCLGILIAVYKYKNFSTHTSCVNTSDDAAHNKQSTSHISNTPSSPSQPCSCLLSRAIYTLLFQQYYIPAFYKWLFSHIFARVCRFLLGIEQCIFIASMQAIGRVLLWLSRLCALLQNGSLSSMLRLMLFGVLVLLASFVLMGGR